MSRTLEIMKRLQDRGVYLAAEHARTEGGSAILLAAEDFLFPQHDELINEFKQGNKAWLQEKAKKLLEEHSLTAAPEVLARWKSIVDGTFFS